MIPAWSLKMRERNGISMKKIGRVILCGLVLLCFFCINNKAAKAVVRNIPYEVEEHIIVDDNSLFIPLEENTKIKVEINNVLTTKKILVRDDMLQDYHYEILEPSASNNNLTISVSGINLEDFSDVIGSGISSYTKEIQVNYLGKHMLLIYSFDPDLVSYSFDFKIGIR